MLLAVHRSTDHSRPHLADSQVANKGGTRTCGGCLMSVNPHVNIPVAKIIHPVILYIAGCAAVFFETPATIVMYTNFKTCSLYLNYTVSAQQNRNPCTVLCNTLIVNDKFQCLRQRGIVTNLQ